MKQNHRTEYTDEEQLNYSNEQQNKTDIHELKTWTQYYKAVENGDKTFEIRKIDRDFKVGDILILKEVLDKGYSSVAPNETILEYTGNQLQVKITYILDNATQFGLMPHYCIMGIKKI